MGASVVFLGVIFLSVCVAIIHFEDVDMSG